MSIELINIILIIFLISAGVAATQVKELVSAVFLIGAYSFFFCILLTVLRAPDVSFTEAMVGTGASTIFLILALFQTSHVVKKERSQKHPWFAFLCVALLGVFFIWGSVDLPALGNLLSPASTHLSPYYLMHAYHDTHTPNVVTSIVVDYRSFDTLVEGVVVFTAGIACLFIIRGKA